MYTRACPIPPTTNSGLQRVTSLRESLKGLCAVAALVAGVDALAVGLGKLELESRLNQPFSAQIPLVGLKAGEMEDVASYVFEAAGRTP